MTYQYKYNCGGFASYSGPCGAPDCGSCRNGSPPMDSDDAEELLEEHCRQLDCDDTVQLAELHGFSDDGPDEGLKQRAIDYLLVMAVDVIENEGIE